MGSTYRGGLPSRQIPVLLIMNLATLPAESWYMLMPISGAGDEAAGRPGVQCCGCGLDVGLAFPMRDEHKR